MTDHRDEEEDDSRGDHRPWGDTRLMHEGELGDRGDAGHRKARLRAQSQAPERNEQGEEPQAETRHARGKWAHRQSLPLKKVDHDDIGESHQAAERDQRTPEHVGGYGQSRVAGEQWDVHAPVPESGELPQREGEQEEDGAAGQANRRRYAVCPRAFLLDGPIDLMGELRRHEARCWSLECSPFVCSSRGDEDGGFS